MFYNWVQILTDLVTHNDVYLITQVKEDVQEQQTLELLREAGIFQSGMNPHKVLFSSTSEGSGHMVRQLEVELHIDTNVGVISHLRVHIPRLLLISTAMRGEPFEKNIRVISDICELALKPQ